MNRKRAVALMGGVFLATLALDACGDTDRAAQPPPTASEAGLPEGAPLETGGDAPGDEKPPVPTEKIRVKVVGGLASAQPLAGVAALLASDRSQAETSLVANSTAVSDALGYLEFEVPVGFARPAILTVAKKGYGALTVAGIEATVPAEVRIDELVPVRTLLGGISGAATGLTTDTTYTVSGHDAVTTRTGGDNYTGQLFTSSQPLELLALRRQKTNLAIILDWVSSGPLPRTAPVEWNPDFSAASPVKTSTITLTVPPGMFPSSYNLDSSAKRVEGDDRAGALISGSAYSPGGPIDVIALGVIGVDGPLEPNRVEYTASTRPTGGAFFFSMLLDSPFATRTVPLPSRKVATDWTTVLYSVTAAGYAAPVWRVYSASTTDKGSGSPGARGLADGYFPKGAPPSAVLPAASLTLETSIVKLRSATTPPWLLRNAAVLLDEYMFVLSEISPSPFSL